MAEDGLMSYFKRQELVSTLGAAATGKYNEYWNVERISDLNNAVDAGVAAGTCPEKLASIFGANATRNTRIRVSKQSNGAKGAQTRMEQRREAYGAD